jgi:PQQ-dependent catabolism-associated CXXCW motif protein
MIAYSEPDRQNEWRFLDFTLVELNLAEEFTDFGVRPQQELRKEREIGSATPTTITGGRVIKTSELYDAIEDNAIEGARFVLVDALKETHKMTIRGAERIPFAGDAGSFDDAIQRQLSERLKTLTKNNTDMPIVFFCEGAATCWESYNASLRAIWMGYTRVYWYRGGLTTWKAAGLPMK